MIAVLEGAFFVLCCLFVLMGVVIELHAAFSEPPLYSEPDDYPDAVRERSNEKAH